MTFEAGRKKQILVLQPKGKPLYENDDQSSFGLKMLQSMGWKKGNGLGKSQQGNLDFLQVRYKNNANGLGFDGLKDNQWTQNEESFDSLLKNLNSQSNSNSNSGDEKELKKAAKSLEEMSKQSRARVHYKKFTRGKDVYKYSAKDLANILGKKSLKEPELKAEEVITPVEVDKPDTYNSDLIVNAGVSITEYFNQKRKEKLANANGTNRRHRRDSQKFIEEDIVPEMIQDESETIEIPKKKKKKSKCNGNDHEIEEIAPIIENQAIENSEESNTKKRKKKKADLIEPVEEEQEVPAKKKKKSKVIEEPLPTQEITDEKIIKKKKKKQTKDSEEPAQAVSNQIPESPSNNKNKSNLDVDRPRGANAVYATDVVLIPSHVAQKMVNVQINKFNYSNIGDIVGYGMTDDIEIKVVETKMGNKDAINNDKYALYNMDRIARERINPRKILTKIKKTKKSIQVI
ncbi:hypothetical protein ACKWTF_006725 [Chironomus riparius]